MHDFLTQTDNKGEHQESRYPLFINNPEESRNRFFPIPTIVEVYLMPGRRVL